MVDKSVDNAPEAYSPVLDAPPSYDDLTYPSTSSSSSQPNIPSSSSSSQPPKDTLYLFQGPPNAEPLLGRMDTPLDVLNSIETLNAPGGWISTHDPRLENPTVLYDFIRYQVLKIPKYTLTCEGAHFETPERDEWVQDQFGPRQRRKGQQERVIDFSFTIDLTPMIAHTDNFANVHLSTAAGDVPISRGTHEMTYSSDYAPAVSSGSTYAAIANATTPGRAATRKEFAERIAWVKWRNNRGLPPWAKAKDWKEFRDRKGKSAFTHDDPEGRLALRDNSEDEERDVEGAATMAEHEQANLREWCEAYCAQQAWCKEFYVRDMIWGWNVEGLKTAIRGAITSTGYNSNFISIDFRANTNGLVVRPSNSISRLLNKTWVCVLLWLTMLYPFIWTWKRFASNGGAPYDIARASYGMKYYPPLPSTYPGETLATAQERLGGMYKVHRELPKPASLVPGPKGIHYLLGRKEGEWFREWEERIRMGVRTRFRGELTGGGEEEAGVGLDGY